MMLSYNEIPKYSEIVDRSKKNSVRLSKQQYSLFKKLNRADIGPLRGVRLILDMLGYAWTLAAISISARHIFLLAYFYNHDRESRNDILVVEEPDDIVITFNASAPHQEFN